MQHSLWRFVLVRSLLVVPLLLGVVVINFVIIQVAPGDPIDVLTGEFPVTPEFEAQLRAELGLDKSPPEQLVSYVTNVLQGDLGFSFRNRVPVSEAIVTRIPATLLLMATAMILAALVGITLGVAAALRPYSWLDNAVSVLAILGYSIPGFWLGLILLVALSVHFAIFPVFGISSIAGPRDPLGSAGDIAWHLVLPALALALRYIAINTRITRAAMIDVLQQDYMITARAKGLARRAVIWKHGFRNALIPVVTVLGLEFGSVLTGSAVIETVFGWPGIGRLLVDSISTRDYPVILGIFMLGATTAVFVNLVTDILYAVFDPRIRYA
jgi:peptide/nickel transport system permease protein